MNTIITVAIPLLGRPSSEREKELVFGEVAPAVASAHLLAGGERGGGIRVMMREEQR